MPKYRKPPQSVADEPRFFVKHYWHLALAGARTHRDQVTTAVMVVVVAFLGLVLWTNYARGRDNDAWAAVGTAASAPEIEAAARKYGGNAGAFLKLRLADGYVLTAEPAKAAAVYREMAAHEDALIAGRATLSLALALEGEGKFDEARAVFESLEKTGGFWGAEAAKALKGQAARQAAHANLAAMQEEARAKETAAAQAASEGAPVALESTAIPESESNQADEAAAQAQPLESTESNSAPSGQENQ